MKITKIFIIIISVVLIASIFAWYKLNNIKIDNKTAVITQNGEVVQTIDLGAVTEPYEFDVKTEKGSNTVLVEHDRICVKNATCPDQVCVKQGYIFDSAVPIVCLPNKLVIKITSANSEIDTVTK